MVTDFTGSLDTSPSYKFVIQNSRLIVCTYPQTTFSEAMASGKSTILLYVPKYNELIPEAEPLLEILRNASIVFTDADMAAKHINQIWPTIDERWNSNEVENARNAYFDTALRIISD